MNPPDFPIVRTVASLRTRPGALGDPDTLPIRAAAETKSRTPAHAAVHCARPSEKIERFRQGNLPENARFDNRALDPADLPAGLGKRAQKKRARAMLAGRNAAILNRKESWIDSRRVWPGPKVLTAGQDRSDPRPSPSIWCNRPDNALSARRPSTQESEGRFSAFSLPVPAPR